MIGTPWALGQLRRRKADRSETDMDDGFPQAAHRTLLDRAGAAGCRSSPVVQLHERVPHLPGAAQIGCWLLFTL